MLGYNLENCTFYEIIAHSHTLVHVVTINRERYTILQLTYTFLSMILLNHELHTDLAHPNLI